MSKQERWRDVLGFEGLYQVSDWGRVKSVGRTVLRKNGSRMTVRERLLSLTPRDRGYPRVRLHGKPRVANRFVHRLVLEAFVGPCPEGMECRHHPDRTRTNNYLENLQWGTPLENAGDTARDGTQYRVCGELHHSARLSQADVDDIKRLLREGWLQKDVAQLKGVSKTAICNINTGRRWAGRPRK